LLQTLKLYSSIAILLIAFSASAQQKEVKADTVPKQKKEYAPTGVRIGTDAMSIARNFYDDTFSGWEVNGDVDFYRYLLAVDVGSWSRNFKPDSGSYSSKGSYWRVGADVNFLLKDPDRNLLFFGVRYGRSTFSETYNERTVDPSYGSLFKTHTNTDVNGRWYELTGGIRVKVWKMMWMGYTARFKFGLKTNETGELIPSDVPGYGRTDKDNVWGFNYQIFIRIPVRNAKSGPLKQ
jgi:hypothetical protein